MLAILGVISYNTLNAMTHIEKMLQLNIKSSATRYKYKVSEIKNLFIAKRAIASFMTVESSHFLCGHLT